MWDAALTLRLHRAHEKELALRPPAEAFLAAYFEAQGWWRAPHEHGDDTPETAPQSDLPEFEQ
jgi:hypothetical protein